MLWNIISVTVILTLFGEVFCENTFLNETIHIRVKRGKYYSYPSRFYKRPPNIHPIKGAFSLTPPPGYMMDEEEPPYPGPGRPHDRPKVSKKPNDGLRDEDINNIVKYLSKQDLDKLLDMASEKERLRENSVERRPYKRDESRVIKDTEYANQGFVNGPYKIHEADHKFGENGHWISQENSVERQPYKRDESRVIKDTEYATQGFVNGPYKTQEPDHKYGNNGHWISQENSAETRPYKRDESRVIKDTEYATQGFVNGPYKTQESDHKYGDNGHWISQENLVERRPYKRDESRVKDTEYSQVAQGSVNGPYIIQEPNNRFGGSGLWTSQETASDSVPINFKPQEEVYHSPFKSQNTEQFSLNPQGNNHNYNGPYAPTEDLLNYVEDATQSKIIYANNDNANLQTEESMQNKQISHLNAYIHHEINDLPNQAFTETQREELLPRPVNLREDDFDISYTNNVPTVVKGPSYKVENFGDLPLMSNAYKLDTVSSYKVPHYTVTSNAKYSPPPPPPPPSSSVPLEPAPPISAAKEQSDAHLKAIKIWTHRSQGTAYTLHKDGTLSLERQRPKNKYGP